MQKLKIKKSPGVKAKLPLNQYSFIIGNGTSRAGLNIKTLSDYGLVYACNWFFNKEFRPHVLIASDEPMTKTIIKEYSHYPRRNWFYTWFPKPGSGAKKATTPEKFSAGGIAAYTAVDVYKSNKVFLIGMDFFGFGSQNSLENGQINNLYEGMKHYAKVDEGELNTAPTYRNWQRRFQWIIQQFPNVEFYHVNPFEGKSPERLRGLSNFHQITYDNLIDHLTNDAPLVDILNKTEEDVQLANEINPDNVIACLERQIAGQENVLYTNLLNPQDIVDMRIESTRYHQRHGFDKGILEVGIGSFRVPIMPPVVEQNNVQMLLSEQEIVNMYEQELVTNQKLVEEFLTNNPHIQPITFDLSNSVPPAPPPVPVPPPPPPPPM